MSQELKSTRRRVLTVIVQSLIGINISLAGLAAANAIVISPIVYIGLGIASLVAQYVKVEFEIEADKVAFKGGPA